MTAKGRSPRGEKHGSAKLTAEQVSRIKTMLAEDRMYMSEIAREFGVAQTTIRAIKRGKTWKEVAAGR
jgi:DNA invertase Pin-like site-specific DNA recombinase